MICLTVYGESREDLESCSTTSGYSSTVTDMSMSVGGGKEGTKPGEEEEERKGVIDMEEDAFTPPDGGLRVSKIRKSEDSCSVWPIWSLAFSDIPDPNYCCFLRQQGNIQIYLQCKTNINNFLREESLSPYSRSSREVPALEPKVEPWLPSSHLFYCCAEKC